MLNNWKSEAEIETNELYDDIDMESFSANLLELEETLYPSDDEEEDEEEEE